MESLWIRSGHLSGSDHFEFDAEKGFFLNGESMKIKGVCNHHDLGALGAAAYPRAMERQLELLKAMGCNAIRTSHNPPAPVLLDLCDRMGFLVMDETFDMWKMSKTEFDYHLFWDEWHERDLRDHVLRDRNHPSVIMWSIGNEIPGAAARYGGRDGHRTGLPGKEDRSQPGPLPQDAMRLQQGTVSSVRVLWI